METGIIRASYNQETAAWSVDHVSSFDLAGITFTIDGSGQVGYTTTNMAGTGYVGDIRIKEVKKFQAAPFSITNNAGPLDVTGLLFDKDFTKAAKIPFHLFRRDDVKDCEEMGQLLVSYNIETSTWRISLLSQFDDCEVTFTITAAGQVQYTSSDFAGGNHNGELRLGDITQIDLTGVAPPAPSANNELYVEHKLTGIVDIYEVIDAYFGLKEAKTLTNVVLTCEFTGATGLVEVTIRRDGVSGPASEVFQLNAAVGVQTIALAGTLSGVLGDYFSVDITAKPADQSKQLNVGMFFN